MKGSGTHIRAFIAAGLPEEVKTVLQDLQGQLRKSGIKASWPSPDTMHLTLKFLGNIGMDQVEGIKRCMEKAVAGIPVHSLSASGIGVFPSVKRARVIWSGTRGQTDVLERLALELDRGLFNALGFFQETKRFFPHVTLARVKQSVPPKKMIQLLQVLAAFHSDPFSVSRIHLFQSELSSQGAVHRRMYSTPLLGG